MNIKNKVFTMILLLSSFISGCVSLEMNPEEIIPEGLNDPAKPDINVLLLYPRRVSTINIHNKNLRPFVKALRQTPSNIKFVDFKDAKYRLYVYHIDYVDGAKGFDAICSGRICWGLRDLKYDFPLWHYEDEIIGKSTEGITKSGPQKMRIATVDFYEKGIASALKDLSNKNMEKRRKNLLLLLTKWRAEQNEEAFDILFRHFLSTNYRYRIWKNKFRGYRWIWDQRVPFKMFYLPAYLDHRGTDENLHFAYKMVTFEKNATHNKITINDSKKLFQTFTVQNNYPLSIHDIEKWLGVSTSVIYDSNDFEVFQWSFPKKGEKTLYHMIFYKTLLLFGYISDRDVKFTLEE